LAHIPYLSLIPKNSSNILAAGRCIGADGQTLGPVRITSTCFAIGEAAGTAAGLAIKGSRAFKNIDVSTLRDTLKANGALVE
jgi:hypothetical protein